MFVSLKDKFFNRSSIVVSYSKWENSNRRFQARATCLPAPGSPPPPAPPPPPASDPSPPRPPRPGCSCLAALAAEAHTFTSQLIDQDVFQQLMSNINFDKIIGLHVCWDW